MDKNNKERMIEMELHRLDCFACEVEAKWGVGNLISYADEGLKKKWYSQNEKLDDAVSRNHVAEVRKLVDGTMRGWDALEKNAVAKGKKPTEPEYMEIKLPSGFHLRIAKSSSQARSCTESGVYVWSLAEVARVIEKDYTLVSEVKDVFPEAEVVKVDFETGDKIPEF